MGGEFDHKREAPTTDEQAVMATDVEPRPEDERAPVRLSPVAGVAAPTDPFGGTRASTDVAAALANPGAGRPLPAPLRRSMERELGADFGAVRIHDDAGAGALARDVSARAFTHGSHVYFGDGAYRPDSGSGRHTLAHELTHVAQQQQGRDRGAGGGGEPVIGRADDPLEAEAERSASRVVQSLQRAGRKG
jgi:hypothetical protein